MPDIPPIGENPLSQKYFGENFDDLLASFNLLKDALTSADAEWAILFDRLFAGADIAIMGFSDYQSGLIDETEHQEYQDTGEVERLGESFDGSQPVLGPFWTTNVLTERLLAQLAWLSDVRDHFSETNPEQRQVFFNALKDALNTIKRWKLHGGKK